MEESMTSDRRALALAEERIKIAVHYSQRGRTMRRIAVTTIGMLMTMCAATAHADVVTDWNQIAIDMLKAANVNVNPWSRSMAMVHVAMSDAINTVQGRYTTYTAKLPAAPNASAEAAAVSAARHILIQLLPAQRAKIDEAYADSLARLPDGAAKNDGITLGERVAALVQADRATDATNAPDTYRPITTPGVWIPTQPPSFAEYAQAKPWGMNSADQFRPGPPPPLSSALYARDYNETKDLGGAKSVKRTAQQTEAVRFWTTGNFLPSWNQVASQLSAAKGLGLAENARLFALLNMGIANNYICDWDAKFHYNRWRPVTAIRDADASRISVVGGHRGRRLVWRPRIGVRHRIFADAHGDRQRRFPAPTSVQQYCADSRRAKDGADLGRHPFPQFAGGQRTDGPQARRTLAQQHHEAGSLRRSP
jgi:hypothetical protein